MRCPHSEVVPPAWKWHHPPRRRPSRPPGNAREKTRLRVRRVPRTLPRSRRRQRQQNSRPARLENAKSRQSPLRMTRRMKTTAETTIFGNFRRCIYRSATDRDSSAFSTFRWLSSQTVQCTLSGPDVHWASVHHSRRPSPGRRYCPSAWTLTHRVAGTGFVAHASEGATFEVRQLTTDADDARPSPPPPDPVSPSHGWLPPSLTHALPLRRPGSTGKRQNYRPLSLLENTASQTTS